MMQGKEAGVGGKNMGQECKTNLRGEKEAGVGHGSKRQM